eukprot:TRINITY_DN14182_c0_g1_i2.p1 TRINITY_DN14182_c0_g1~~TRINITY_DN14182_c0_g1_i2.p1  ORF type:complete len:1280 (-),score=211.37 TRINITY_DN14182_c0_g1_i2:82-3900(-)
MAAADHGIRNRLRVGGAGLDANFASSPCAAESDDAPYVRQAIASRQVSDDGLDAEHPQACSGSGESQPATKMTMRMAGTAMLAHAKLSRRKRAPNAFETALQEDTFLRTPPESDDKEEKQSCATSSARATQCKPKFGEVQFRSGLMTKACIVGPGSDPEKFYELIMREPTMWDLQGPRLILSIVGGAGEMDLDPAVEAHFCEGLVRAAKQTCGWIVTGGTASGVMDLVGKAMHMHDKRRQVPCIGITTFGSLKTPWRDIADLMDPVPDAAVVEAPLPAKEQNPDDVGLAALQEHHTHCVMVDVGKKGRDAFGKEVDFREKLESFVATGLTSSIQARRLTRGTSENLPVRGASETSHDGSISPHRRHAPSLAKIQKCDSKDLQERDRVLRVMILVNGGPVSFNLVKGAIEHGCPVVICNKSGRAADFIASLKSGNLTDYEEAWNTHMTAPPDVKMGLAGVPGGPEALKRIVESSLLTIYTTDDRLEDVILGAVVQNFLADEELADDQLINALKRAMELAVQWGCEKRYVELARNLVNKLGFQDAAHWLLQKIVNDWSESGPELGSLMRWLLSTHGDALRKIEIANLRPRKLSFSDVELILAPGEKTSYAHLFVWLMENKAPVAVTDVLWLHLDYPAHGALAAAAICRQAGERMMSQGTYEDSVIGQRLTNAGNRYETMAVQLLKSLDRVDPLEYVFRRSWRWGNHHLISLAHHLECKEFVSQSFYNSAVDLLWVTPTPFAVFAFDKDPKRRQKNKVTAPYHEILLGLVFWKPERLPLRDLYSVPRVKAMTHALSRFVFVFLYSYYVIFARDATKNVLSLFLLLWGVSLGLVEALQITARGGIWAYLNMWNVLDLVLIAALLLGSFAFWFLTPTGLVSTRAVNAIHSLNLLPCYVRLLQLFELSEYFGTLLFTMFGMAQDTTHFLVLLGIISLGFSCSMTPILYHDSWQQGISWGFWAIFGGVELGDSGRIPQEELPMVLQGCTSFLQYFLIIASNVLLVNLLIAMLNDTYQENKERSRREWAFNRVDAVLEFASPEAHILPPPLDLWVSVQTLMNWNKPVSEKDSQNSCKVTKVVPLGPHEVEIHIEVQGGDFDAADESQLSWEESQNDSSSPSSSSDSNGRVKQASVSRLGDWQPVPAGSDGEQPHAGVLCYKNVPLTMPLRFAYGKKELGYKAVPIHLDEDSWTRSLTGGEKKHIAFIQQEVVAQIDADQEPEQRSEAVVMETNQKMGLCLDEITRLVKQVKDLEQKMDAQDKRHAEMHRELLELRVAAKE